jgi:hypothetical protein
VFLLVFWQAMTDFDDNGNRRAGPLGIRTPTPLAWINPFVAQADVLCGTESTFGGGWCSFVNGLVPSENGVIIRDGGAIPVPAPPMPGEVQDKGVAVGGQPIRGGFGENDVAAANQAFGPLRDTLWTRSVALWLGLSAVFVFLSVQAVSPTRRWHLRRPTRGPASPAP